MVTRFTSLMIALFFLSCQATDGVTRDEVVAKVGNTSLHRSDLISLFGEAYSPSDLNVKVFVNNWVRNQVVVQHAETNLLPEQRDFSKELKEYEQSLLRYTIESKYVSERIDSFIQREEIKEYYDSNASNFELKENYVKVRVLKLPKNCKWKNLAKKKIQYSNQEEKVDYLEWVKDHDLFYVNNDTAWVKWEAVKELVPIKIYNDESFLSNNNFKEIWLEEGMWFLKIDAYQLKDNISPMEMVESRIRSILINKRKVALIKQMEKELYQQALKKGEIKTNLN